MQDFYVVLSFLIWGGIWYWFIKTRGKRGLFMSNILGGVLGFIAATIVLGVVTPAPTAEEKIAQETLKRDQATAKAIEDAEAASKKLEQEKNLDRSTMAAIICSNYVEQSLKAPKSADFPFSRSEGGIKRFADQRYKIRSYVDAQNAFGAQLRNWYICDIQYLSGNDGDMRNWTVHQLTFEK